MSKLSDRIFGDRFKSEPKEHKHHCIYCGKESDGLYCSEECMSNDKMNSQG